MRAGLLPAPQWLFLKRLLYSFSILNSGRQSASLTQRLDLLHPERASWSLCYGRFIAPCSKERLQSHASPCTHLLSSSLPAYIDLVLFPYRFRIVSASGSENDRRMIGERYGINTGLIRDWYEIDTRTIRERYENGLFRLLTDEIDKYFNLFIIISLDYILHFSH